MNDMPEVIYAFHDTTYLGHGDYREDQFWESHNFYGGERYIRADLMPQWRPISEAPRDGTDVLVFYEVANTQFAHIAFYDDGQLDPDEDYDPDAVGWWSYVWSSVRRYKLEGLNEPTHWMPLPEPPEQEDE